MYLLHNELNFIVMNNKHCIFLSGVAALVTLPSFAQSKGASEKPMNILYIMSDDHSFQTISAYDHRFIETPNIDRIGNEGVVFTNSFLAHSIPHLIIWASLAAASLATKRRSTTRKRFIAPSPG